MYMCTWIEPESLVLFCVRVSNLPAILTLPSANKQVALLPVALNDQSKMS